MIDLKNNIIRQLASNNRNTGVLYEPRMYYDRITFSGDVQAFGDPGVFRNGEEFPVRITHMAISLPPVTNTPTNPTPDYSAIFSYGLRMLGLNNDYMGREVINLATWATEQNGTVDYFSNGAVTWQMERPVILSSRDSLIVQAQASTFPPSAKDFSVSFDGIGKMTGRPYKLFSRTKVNDSNLFTLNVDDFRNDGVEPIELYSMSASYSGGFLQSSAVGTVEDMSVMVQQIGNGTNAPWFAGPVGLPALQLMPLALLGITGGHALVHRFPWTDEDAHGFVLEPGQGVQFEMEPLDPITIPTPFDSFDIALAGYIMVT